MSDEIVGNCWNCGQGLVKLDYGRELDCPACRNPTHCCRNCRHHAPGRPNECMEPMVERVIDKTRANFCDLLEPKRQRADDASSNGDALRRAAQSLFK